MLTGEEMQARRGQGAAYSEGVLCLTAPKGRPSNRREKQGRLRSVPVVFSLGRTHKSLKRSQVDHKICIKLFLT